MNKVLLSDRTTVAERKKGLLSFFAPELGKHARIAELLRMPPVVASKLFLTNCLLDRVKSESARDIAASASLANCKVVLNELRYIWNSCEVNASANAVDATYKVNLLMTALEHLMARLPQETRAYECLQRCINLLDEVDLILETFGVQRVPVGQLSK